MTKTVRVAIFSVLLAPMFLLIDVAYSQGEPPRPGRMVTASKNKKTYLIGSRETLTLSEARAFCRKRNMNLPHMREVLDARESGLLRDAHYEKEQALLWSSSRLSADHLLLYGKTGKLLLAPAKDRKAYVICVKRSPDQESRIRRAAEMERLREKFPLWTFKNFRRVVANAPEYETRIFIDARVPPLSVVVKTTGKLRRMPPARRAKLEMLNELPNFQRFVMQYTMEMEVEEQGRRYWLPLQPRHVDRARTLQPETELTVFLRQPGCCFTEPEMRIFLVINFSEQIKERLPPMECFAKKILEAEVGGLMSETMLTLNQVYGAPRREFERGDLKYHAYLVDKKMGTSLYIADGGFRNRRRVYSIQISGPPNPDLEVMPGVRLGDAVGSLREKLQLESKPKTTGKFEVWNMKKSWCSIQTLNGKLTSVLIQADPNYFRE